MRSSNDDDDEDDDDGDDGVWDDDEDEMMDEVTIRMTMLVSHMDGLSYRMLGGLLTAKTVAADESSIWEISVFIFVNLIWVYNDILSKLM